MASIIVSPSEQRRFADYLMERTKELMQKQRKFTDMINDARAICQDARYADFRKKVEETALLLEDFSKRAERYSEFLHQKARAGERYLKG
jgi:hypothetical protein